MTISPEQIAEWKSLVDGATPEMKYHADLAWLSGVDPDGEMYTVAEMDHGSRHDGKCYNHRANGAFIAAARTALPALLAEVERLRAVLARIETAQPFVDWHDDDGTVIWWPVSDPGSVFVEDPRSSDWEDTGGQWDEDDLMWCPLPNPIGMPEGE